MAGINSPEDFPGIPPMAFWDGPGGGGNFAPGGGGGGGGFLPPGSNFVNGIGAGPNAVPQSPWSPTGIRRRMGAAPTKGYGTPASPWQGPFGNPIPQAPGPGQGPAQPGPFNPQNEQFGSVIDILNNLITHGVRGDMPGYGGAFSLNPPQGILDSARQQQVSDAGAQERAARLGLRSNPNTDPSTYGFQSLISQLQGQSNTSRNMAQADMGLRQQQLQNYWNLLSTLYGGHQGALNTIASQPQQQSGWGQFLGGIGNAVGAAGRPWWLGG